MGTASVSQALTTDPLLIFDPDVDGVAKRLSIKNLDAAIVVHVREEGRHKEGEYMALAPGASLTGERIILEAEGTVGKVYAKGASGTPAISYGKV